MQNKLISSIMLACSFAVMPLAGSHPNNLLFVFISPNKWAGVIRLVLALTMFFVSFTSLEAFNKIVSKHKNGRVIATGVGISLIIFGLVSAMESSLGTIFYDYFKPLDLLILLEAGVILTSTALKTVDLKKMPVRKAAAKKARKTAPALHQEPA